MLLTIGNKKYSSWSLRAWLALRMAGVEFQEERIPLFVEGFKERLAERSPSALVPVLKDGDLVVHDSLAIAEYVNEKYARGRLYPADMEERALARSVCAEMHSGFTAIRSTMPMNLARRPEPSRVQPPSQAALERELNRLTGLWEDLRRRFSARGPFLFGEPGIAEAMYLPMATRLKTYGVSLGHAPLAREYVEHLHSWELFQPWLQDALRETEVIAEDEA
ncbi:MAG: glutathione S-transferase family protein [Deltaproteobacteria bacterium]|nr:glutathione S-transferase family protein [Deltaproteobacteria bacterium]